MSDFPYGRLEAELKEREEKQLRRSLSIYDDSLINLADNDYFSLAASPVLKRAAKEAIDLHGTSSSASPLLGGYKETHAELLEKLKAWYGMPHALLWNSGYTANQALLSSLPGSNDVIIADRLIHNSMISGIRRSPARLMRYKHLAIGELEEKLEANKKHRCFVVTESLFSMDGDYPDLKRIAHLKDKYSFIWLLDEAHAIGWYGKSGSGLAEQYNVLNQVDILVGTLGKALGSMGAFTLFRNASVADYLINFSGEFIYSTYLPPSCAAAASAAMDLLMSSDRTKAGGSAIEVRRRIKELGLKTIDGNSPIVPIIVGDEGATLSIRDRMLEKNILVGAVRPPTVPKGESRIRLSLKADMSTELIDTVISALKGAL